MKNPALIIFLSLVGLAQGLGFWFWQQSHTGHPDLAAGTLLDQPRGLPELKLRDQEDKEFSTRDFKDYWNLLFFGFTHCPDICPNTLGLLRQIKRDLNNPQLRVVFISLDPKRDTSQRLHDYVRYFDPEFIGLTGDQAELEKFSASLYLPYSTTKPDAEGNYSVDHSASLVLVNPAAAAVAYFSAPHQRSMLAGDLETLLTK
ncbi:MAG: SCO family protein [Nevskiales bacterium]